jgi:hypothetical protein
MAGFTRDLRKTVRPMRGAFLLIGAALGSAGAIAAVMLSYGQSERVRHLAAKIGIIDGRFPKGRVTVLDGFRHYEKSGFSFARNTIIPWNSPEADILVSNQAVREAEASFYLPTDPPFDGGIQEDDGHAGGGSDCPQGGYQPGWFKPAVKLRYCVKTRNGLGFARVVVEDIKEDNITFTWIADLDGTGRFPAETAQ